MNRFSQRLLGLIDDKAKRLLMGETALQVMRENYSLDTWRQKIMTVLSKILCEKSDMRKSL